MDSIERLYEEAKRVDMALNRLLFDHGDDEMLAAATEYSEGLLWCLKELKNERGLRSWYGSGLWN